MINFFRRFRSAVRDTRGVSLLATFGLTIVLVVLATGAAKLVMGFIKTTKQVESANVAYLAAEGGIEMALYDLSAYKDGYQTDANKTVCGDAVDPSQTTNFSDICSDADPYRFVDFAGTNLSDGVGFWRLFSRTLAVGTQYYVPNPYFAGDKDGGFEAGEWGTITKGSPFTISLLIDKNPDQSDPDARFLYLSDQVDDEKKIIIAADTTWDPSNGASSSEEVLTWTFSAIDGNGEEHTLQGVVWEDDFLNQDCNEDTVVDADEYCFIFDLSDDWGHSPDNPDGDVYAGEDINRNLSSTPYAGFNRVADVSETFRYATPFEFIEDLNTAMNEVVTADQWTSARLTINLISTLSETSGLASNSLSYKLDSEEQWADEYTYIVSEGFSGNVKQTIETRFRRESAIPIFSYVIFQ